MSKKIVNRRPSQLIPNESNARTHDEDQIGQLCNSIEEFGFTNPILIDKQNNIIAGHGRFEAAKQLGFDWVPCIVLENLTDAQLKALAIADNKLALNSGWDFELLRAELSDLQAIDFDMDLIGFSEKELENILGDPETKEKPKTETVTGDRFLLMVEFDEEPDCAELFSELDERGYECKILT